MDAADSFCAVNRSTIDPVMPIIGSDDEESFVVLGTSSMNEDIDEPLSNEILPPIRSGKVHEMQNLIKMELSQINNATAFPEMPSAADTLNAVTTSVANITLSPDSSHEEIQKKVEEVIKENEKLKNVISQNNLSMKAHYDKILAWKDDVNKVVKSYKDKIIEAKSYIEKCKEENNRLANDVEKYKKIKELQDEEIMNLKSKGKEHKTETCAEQNMVEFDLQVAKQKIADLQTALADANFKKAELMVEVEKFSQKRASAPLTLGHELKSLQLENQTINQQIEVLRIEILSLKDALDIEKAEKANLIAENEKLTQKLVSTPNTYDLLQAKDNEIKQLQIANQTHQEQIIRARNEIDNLEKELNIEKQKNPDPFTSSISSVAEIKEKYEIKVTQLEVENYSLKEEVVSLKYSLGGKEALEEKFNHLREQLAQTQKTVTAHEVEHKMKVREIEELRKLLQSSSKSDEIYALNEQLALYKSDFEAERESKNAIKQERDQMAEDLKNLQKRNKQMQNEIEAIRPPPPKTDGFACPKCNFSFNNYQSLENHVHRCLDLEGFP